MRLLLRCLLLAGCLVVVTTAQQKRHRATYKSLTGMQPPPELRVTKRDTHGSGDNAAQSTGFAGAGHHHHHHGHHHLHGGSGLHHGHHGHHGHGKFFMYAHQPEHKHYEFGFKRGNDKHVVERYEKGGPHHNFKSKFRWHDKHGGHGERYWDYNHAPHYHHDDGHHHDDHHSHHDGGHGYHSEPVPNYVPASAVTAKDAYRQRRKSAATESKKTSIQKKPTGYEKKPVFGPKQGPSYNSRAFPSFERSMDTKANLNDGASSTMVKPESAFNEMLGFDPFSPPDILKDHASVGGISADSTSMSKPHTTRPTPSTRTPYYRKKSKKYNSHGKPTKMAASDEIPKLAYDLDSGRVYNEKTGKWFRLVAD